MRRDKARDQRRGYETWPGKRERDVTRDAVTTNLARPDLRRRQRRDYTQKEALLDTLRGDKCQKRRVRRDAPRVVTRDVTRDVTRGPTTHA